MNKRFTKIICVTVSAIAAAGVAFSTGCGNYFNSKALSSEGVFTDKAAVSNGGFAVEKGDYLYFINGVETNTADNSYGTPVKGAICRISKDNLKSRNYSTVDIVVPLVTYTTDYEAGIFIYGDYIYYGTPSTNKNSEGAVQNSYLDMKRTKLDGTETMKDFFVQFPSAAYEYRYVEENGTVYLLYVATDEKLYDESTGVKNLHSYNTATKEDKVLAYNVDSVTFDGQDKTNPRVYYTMNVYDYSSSANYGYNQIYTVKADATTDKFEGKLSSENIAGWDEEEDRYINCGDLVLDGIGQKDVNGSSKTPFNYLPENAGEVNELSYTYTLKTYLENTLFYTRKTSNNSGEYLFSLKDGNYAPVSGNPSANDTLLTDGSNAGDYKYIFKDGALESVIIAESGGGISINKAENGKLQSDEKPGISNEKYFKIVKEETATLLTVDTANHFLYYSVTSGNDWSINRIDYSGSVSDYEPLSAGDTDYTAVKILDLSATSTWYKPEFIDGYLLFGSMTDNMTSYNYVMVFDMNVAGGIMSNAEIRKLNEMYKNLDDIISGTFGDANKYPANIYANIVNVLNYASYEGDGEYFKELAEVLNADIEEGGNLVYSEQTFREYNNFLTPAADNAWADFTDKKTVNGREVYANTHAYYYSVLGNMNEKDAKAYAEGLQTKYLLAYPEEETTDWYAGLSTGAKAGFITGMCAAGLLVVGGAVVLTVYLVRRKKKNNTSTGKKRIKVDMTDDKDIDVYSDET